MLCKLCGDAALKNVVLITNMWSEVPPNVGEAREKELSSEFFKPASSRAHEWLDITIPSNQLTTSFG